MSKTNKCGVRVYTLFVNFTVLSMEFPIANYLPFFFQTDVNFLSDFLVRYSGQWSKQITD